MDKNLYEKLKETAHLMRIDSLRMSVAAGPSGAHFGGGLSMIEIMAVLYLAIMKVDPKKPDDELRDRFILSKGHGVLAYYAALKQIGFITDSDLDTFKTNETFLYGHPSMDVSRGIEFSSGSLGQGLSLGVGTCMALKRKNNTTSKVYVLLGDGECNEGSIWEAACSASHYNLNQLVVIVDKNQLQYDGDTNSILSMDNLEDKWKSFGWDTISIDGHSVEELHAVLVKEHDKPLAILANTVKGKGISFMENNPLYHHSVLSKKQYEEAMKELGVLV